MAIGRGCYAPIVLRAWYNQKISKDSVRLVLSATLQGSMIVGKDRRSGFAIPGCAYAKVRSIFRVPLLSDADTGLSLFTHRGIEEHVCEEDRGGYESAATEMEVCRLVVRN